MTNAGHALLLLALAVPLAIAAFVPLVRNPLRLLPWAAAPGLAAALFAPQNDRIELVWFVLGIGLELDGIGAAFLGFGSLLWLLAGAYACSYLNEHRHLRWFSMFWLLTLAGTLGTFIAADVVTFYLSFSVMSLAAYGLVIHDRTAAALRAGRVYIVLAILGETILVATFMLAATDADSLAFVDVRASMVESPWTASIVAGLAIGFGIKAGLVPLHVWLPLAHPEAPTPASAVLSGVIVKAGIMGLIRLLPMDTAMPAWSDVLIVAGLVTAYYGVAVGLLQTDAKAILAYSTLSQMGLVVTVLGAGLGEPNIERALSGATFYAMHEGLAKGALFLSIGIVGTADARTRRAVLIATAMMALAIAGLPLSGGALAKYAVKETLGEGIPAVLVALSAAGTTLLMLRFLQVLVRTKVEPRRTPSWGLIVPWAGVVAAAAVVPWTIYGGLSGQSPLATVTSSGLWAALWPMLMALPIAAIVALRWQHALPTLPQGDIIVFAESALRRIHAGMARTALLLDRLAELRPPHTPVSQDRVYALEGALRNWSVAGAAFILVAATIALSMAL
jgi:hydrogenase-4 component B